MIFDLRFFLYLNRPNIECITVLTHEQQKRYRLTVEEFSNEWWNWVDTDSAQNTTESDDVVSNIIYRIQHGLCEYDFYQSELDGKNKFELV